MNDTNNSVSDLGKIKQQISSLGKMHRTGIKKIEIGINKKDLKKTVTLKQS